MDSYQLLQAAVNAAMEAGQPQAAARLLAEWRALQKKVARMDQKLQFMVQGKQSPQYGIWVGNKEA